MLIFTNAREALCLLRLSKGLRLCATWRASLQAVEIGDHWSTMAVVQGLPVKSAALNATCGKSSKLLPVLPGVPQDRIRSISGQNKEYLRAE